MEKIIYCCIENIDGSYDGVRNKIFSQVAGLQSIGYDVYLVGYSNCGVCVYHGDVIIYSKKTSGTIKKRFHVVKAVNYLLKTETDIKTCYIRYSSFSILSKKLFSDLKKNNCRVIVEVPTYPLHELTGIKRRFFLNEKQIEKTLSRNIDKLLYIGNRTDTIFGCPATLIPNGINGDISCKNRQIKPSEKIRIISVAYMYPHQGYERIINAMHKYYSIEHGQDQVFLTLIGDGPEKDSYSKLIQEYGLEDHIVLKGKMGRKELLEEYNNADIGLNSLNTIGFTQLSTLKSKEYLQLGLPFVYVIPEIGINENFLYAKKLSCGLDKEIEFEEIVEFAKVIKKQDPVQVSKSMHALARKFTWHEIFLSCDIKINTD